MKIQLQLVDANSYVLRGTIDLPNDDSRLIPVPEDMVKFAEEWWQISRRRFIYSRETVTVILECQSGYPLETPQQTKERRTEQFGDAVFETGPDGWMK